MSKEERLNLRLSSDTLCLLAELVSRKQYGSEAEAVRDAVRIFLESKFTESEVEEILQAHKSKRTFDLNDFTSDDSDVSEVLGNVLDRGLQSERKD